MPANESGFFDVFSAMNAKSLVKGKKSSDNTLRENEKDNFNTFASLSITSIAEKRAAFLKAESVVSLAASQKKADHTTSREILQDEADRKAKEEVLIYYIVILPFYF